MRIREPRTTALIFSSGKLVCTGAKSEEQSHLAARKYARAVQKLGFPAKFLDFKIVNMVGSCDVCFPIRLKCLELAHKQFSSEEQSHLAARKYVRVVQKVGFPGKFLVGSCDVCFPIQLECLELAHKQFSRYEPELVPDLIYRMVKPRIDLVIFVSGKGSSEYMFGEDLEGPPHLQDPSFLSSSISNQQKDEDDDLDLSFLPDELNDIGVYLDCSTARPPEADTEVNTRQPATSPFCNLPMTPMTPVAPVAESSGIIPQLQNIVSTINLACPLDLKAIALQGRNAEYNPKSFAAVIMRIREPKTTALIFSSGKLVCTGAKSEEQSHLAARKYVRVVQKLGFPAKFLDFKIVNMVGSCDVCFPIRLESLELAHKQFSSLFSRPTNAQFYERMLL
ncbi:hypothetical protein HF521_021553 [Silurus meridionalis]|uniref:TATA box-binding protein-like 2 n=1 Tax=Silurus meridionalis TaxID=175797 RepID=A0A8T0BBQ0_SILME|nr:hypothetical protein HF521_021553 [Silurus meridionalis]